MTGDLNPQDVVVWMRSQAKKFSDMADEIERTFRLCGQNGSLQGALVQRIATLLSDRKARRASQIAQEIQTPERQVRNAVAHSNGALTMNERGWITCSVDSTYVSLSSIDPVGSNALEGGDE